MIVDGSEPRSRLGAAPQLGVGSRPGILLPESGGGGPIVHLLEFGECSNPTPVSCTSIGEGRRGFYPKGH